MPTINSTYPFPPIRAITKIITTATQPPAIIADIIAFVAATIAFIAFIGGFIAAIFNSNGDADYDTSQIPNSEIVLVAKAQKGSYNK